MRPRAGRGIDRKSTRLNSSHTDIYTLSLHDALPICLLHFTSKSLIRIQERVFGRRLKSRDLHATQGGTRDRSEEHTSELQSHRYLHSFPTRRSSDLFASLY